MSDYIAPVLVEDTMKIRVLKDQQFSDFMMEVARSYPEVAAELERVTHIPALVRGTIVDDARIDAISGRAYFVRNDYGEPWYLPREWYEVIE